jgi:hypothetical protein
MLGTIKHSKYKNTGILFELLVRQITADTLSGNKSVAVDLLKKYFVKSELGKEYKLFETLLKASKLSEGKANLLVETLIETSKKLNKGILRREKYNLIKELKQHYNLEDLFKTKLPSYKIQAAFSVLVEIYNTAELIDPNQIVQHKVTLLEHLTTKAVDNTKVQADVLQEFQSYDKDLRILTYKLLLEKFNGKYASLNGSQKQILEQYITSIDSTPKLRNFYNEQIANIRKQLTEAIRTTSNKVVKIKLQEVIKFAKDIDKTQQVANEDIVNLMQYHELLHELKQANG